MTPDDANDQIKRFIAECFTLARDHGTYDRIVALKAAVSWGLEPHDAAVYQDDVIEVVAEKAPSKRVLVVRKANWNPVLCTNRDGMPFRWHGEAALIREHVHSAVRGLT